MILNTANGEGRQKHDVLNSLRIKEKSVAFEKVLRG